MACELAACCQFFNDKMRDMPASADYIRNKLCFGDYGSCSRYKIYREGGKPISLDMFPDDSEAVKKALLCLEKSARRNEEY